MTESALTQRHVRILLVLADEPQHGYAIGKRIEGETDGRIRLKPGSLYRAVSQLLDRGLIDEIADPSGDPRRRRYRMTGSGRRALASALAGMGRMVAEGRRLGVLGGDG